MNRRIILFLLVVLMFSYPANIYAQDSDVMNEKLRNSIFYSPDYNSVDINDYIIRLSEDDMVFKDFGSQYQNRLKELADRYGDNQNYLLDIVFADEEVDGSNSNNDHLADHLASDFNINLGYEQLDDNNAAVELNYDVDARTTVRAGYEFSNVNEYDYNEINNTNNEFIEGNNIIISNQNNIDSRLGISYQTTDNIRIFADYVYNDILEQYGESTVFGLEYNNWDSKISAEYSIINELDKQGSSTGLSYKYQDLANFSASYSLLNSDDLTDRLEQQAWDFGVDFNLNEDSSFSIGLQVKTEVLEDNNDNNISDTDDGDNTEEPTSDTINTSDEESTSVEASFKIKF